MTTTPFTTYAYKAGGITARTTPARFADVFNVMDYGAIATGGFHPLSERYGSLAAAQADYPFATALTDLIDGCAIQAAINAAGANGHGGSTVFLPAGYYRINTSIDMSQGGGGRIAGSAAGPTFIEGNVPNEFLFYQLDGANGPTEIASLSITNSSTVIGSGAMYLSNSSMTCNKVEFGGMIGVLLGNNLYDMHFNFCRCGPGFNGGTTGYNGTFGVAGAPCNIKGWRSTNPFMTALSCEGSDNWSLTSSGIENAALVVLLGAKTAWASSCTVSGNTLTIGGRQGATNNDVGFSVGDIIYMSGLPLPNWGNDPFDATGGVTITAYGTGSGHAGTYTLSSGGYSITTPVPCVSRGGSFISNPRIQGIQSEGVGTIVYVYNASSLFMSGVGGGCAANEAVDQFGATGLTARCGIYIRSVTAGTIQNSGIANGGYIGGIVFDPNAACSALTLDSNYVLRRDDNVTTATISDFAGGTGNLLNVTTLTSGPNIGVGQRVTGTGVPANTVITGNFYSDNTLNTTSALNVQVTGSISGTTLTVTATAHGTLRIGDVLLPASGVIQAIIVSGSGTTWTITNGQIVSSQTLTFSHAGYGAVGLYRLNNSANLSSRTITVLQGEDYVMPTNTASKAGLRITNPTLQVTQAGYVSHLNDLAMTFTCLPGQAGASGFIPLVDGMRYDIVDGQKSGTGTALFGDIVVGGGSQHIEVRWNGTNWTRSG